MNIKSALLWVATGCMLAACQSSSYKICGTAEGQEDGDTLFLTTDLTNGIPCDTTIVSDGKFTFEGKADSLTLAMVYSARRNEINANFFLEPGEIDVNISEQPGASRVGGTECNDKWQELVDSVMAIGKRINLIAEHIYGNTVSEEEQAKGMEQIEKLNQHFADVLKEKARKNIKNEFGYFLLTYYPEEVLDNQTRLELIGQLPDNMRNRDAVKQLEEYIKKKSMTAEGTTLPDFSQPAPDGTVISIKEEIGKHKITIIDFWASWCGPCRHDMPGVVELYKEFKDKGLGIVGVSLDNDANAWKKAIDQLKMTWPQMSDLRGWDNAAAQMLSITSIPHTVIVDSKGVILTRGLRGDALRAFIADRLK